MFFFAGASQPVLAAAKATSTIPIVFVVVSDPVGLGVVKSLGRPGSNATGLSSQAIEIQGKRLQLLKEVFPSASRIAVVHNPLECANNRRLPAVYSYPELAEAGGLMSYSFDPSDHYRAAAIYIDKILKGAKPADLPVERATRFELVLNLKTAKAQGVKFPQSILLRADRVIE